MVASLRRGRRGDFEQGQASSWILVLAAAIDLVKRVKNISRGSLATYLRGNIFRRAVILGFRTGGGIYPEMAARISGVILR